MTVATGGVFHGGKTISIRHLDKEMFGHVGWMFSAVLKHFSGYYCDIYDIGQYQRFLFELPCFCLCHFVTRSRLGSLSESLTESLKYTFEISDQLLINI